MKSITITEADAGQSLQKFISKAFPRLPRALMYKEIRKKNIKLNKKRTAADAVLQSGDLIELYLKDDVLQEKEKYYDFMRASNALSVVFEDANIMVIDKPAGVLCHPAGGDYTDNIVARVQRYLYEKGEWSPETAEFSPALANRIDRNTCGLVMAAKNAAALKILNEKIKTHEIKKYYLAIVMGKPEKERETVTSYLTKNQEKNKVTVCPFPTPGCKEIITRYRLLKTNGSQSLLEIELKTGRTHQIRAQLAAMGMPIAGDGKYGNTHARSRQQLCSWRLCFDFNEAGALTYLSGREFTAKSCDFAKQFD
ncbi:MAG: RluA family pseudouridine synthase [Clostridiales bacterium]|nr:RluA family pseudouridine synthase [Clostridiales bacterium]